MTDKMFLTKFDVLGNVDDGYGRIKIEVEVLTPNRNLTKKDVPVCIRNFKRSKQTFHFPGDKELTAHLFVKEANCNFTEVVSSDNFKTLRFDLNEVKHLEKEVKSFYGDTKPFEDCIGEAVVKPRSGAKPRKRQATNHKIKFNPSLDLETPFTKDDILFLSSIYDEVIKVERPDVKTIDYIMSLIHKLEKKLNAVHLYDRIIVAENKDSIDVLTKMFEEDSQPKRFLWLRGRIRSFLDKEKYVQFTSTRCNKIHDNI